MKHSDVKTGVIYAANTGYGRPDFDRTLNPVRVVDTAKDYTLYRPYSGPVEIKRSTLPGKGAMLVEVLNGDGSVLREAVLQPRDLGGTWEEYEAYKVRQAEHRRAMEERRAEQVRRSKALRDRYAAVLGEDVPWEEWHGSPRITAQQYERVLALAEKAVAAGL